MDHPTLFVAAPTLPSRILSCYYSYHKHTSLSAPACGDGDSKYYVDAMLDCINTSI